MIDVRPAFQTLILFTLVLLALAGPLHAADASPESLLKDADGRVADLIAGFKRVESRRPPGQIVFVFQQEARGDLLLTLVARDEDKAAFCRSANFNLFYRSSGEIQAERQQAVAGLMEAVCALVSTNDRGQVRLGEVRAPEAARTPPVERYRPPQGQPDWLDAGLWKWVDRAERGLSAVLLLAFFLALILALPRAMRDWRSMPLFERWGLPAVLIGALLLRLAVPHRLVMTYGGYELIEQAIAFGQLKKYGAGGPLLYHLCISLLPGPGYAVYLTVNSVIGWLTLVPAALWLRRYLKMDYAALALVLILAVHPLLLRDHNSESNLIPAVFAFFIGLLYWEWFRADGRRTTLAFALAAFAFAAVCRPLFILFAPLALLLIELQRADATIRPLSLRRHGALALAAGFVLLPHLVFLGISFSAEQSISNAGGLRAVFDGLLVHIVSPRNLFVNPLATPALIALLWAPAFCRSSVQQVRRLFAVAGLGLLLLLPYFHDMPEPSLYRLQAPAAWFFAMPAAVGVVLLLGAPGRRWLRALRPVLLIALLLAALILPVRFLWLPGNDQSEHRALLDAARSLPQDARVLARLSITDLPAPWGVFRDHPDSLFKARREGLRLIGLSEVDAAMTENGSGGVYAYLGMRCYALSPEDIPQSERARSVPAEAARADYVHPLCAQLRSRFNLQPVFEEAVGNHELARRFLWYPPRRNLRIGLYRVAGKPEQLR